MNEGVEFQVRHPSSKSIRANDLLFLVSILRLLLRRLSPVDGRTAIFTLVTNLSVSLLGFTPLKFIN